MLFTLLMIEYVVLRFGIGKMNRSIRVGKKRIKLIKLFGFSVNILVHCFAGFRCFAFDIV